MTEVANNNSALGAASGELASIKEVAALLQSTISGESGEMADDLADSENLKEVISMLNELSHLSESRLEFEFDQEEDISVIRVVDSDTGELIRQIPPEKLLATMDHVFDTLGIVFDQTA
ncbi:MAG: flagellar protein FlaG [Candidatus Coatesbacteria bacterium]|nr:flagellar protein FlaG [Candidatus Coatesbacteria bacterium]